LLGGGVTWKYSPDARYALRADLSYSHHDATEELIALGSETTQVQIDDGKGILFGLDVNGVYEFPISRRVRGYLTAGVGCYYRRIELTQIALFEGVACDPWWGICFDSVFLTDQLVAKTSTTRLAWNGGIGV